MRRSSLIVLLIVAATILLIRGDDPQLGSQDLGELLTPRPIGEPWDGRQAYLIEPGRAYLIPIRCRIGDKPSLEAIEAGQVDPRLLDFDSVENKWAARGVKTRLVALEIREVSHAVWQLEGGKNVGLPSLDDGMTAITAGRLLSREELVERTNHRRRRDRRPRGPLLELAEVQGASVEQLEIHADVALYLPEGLPPTGDRLGSLARDSSIRASSYGMRVAFQSPDLPAYVSVNYFTADQGRYVARVSRDGGQCDRPYPGMNDWMGKSKR